MSNKNNIVFIVGAGASSEAGLPVGSELKKIIKNSLGTKRIGGQARWQGSDDLSTAFNEIASYENNAVKRLRDAANRISESMNLAPSIDHFINSNSDDEDIITCAKLSVVESILVAERKSRFRNGVTDTKITQSWYVKLFQLLVNNKKVDELDERLESLTLIVFNYDRCIEYFLYNSLKMYYGINDERTAELFNKIKIFHPYGTVGCLPFQGDENSIEFGGYFDKYSLAELSRNIKTFSEGIVGESGNLDEYVAIIRNSKLMVFLGFAFHEMNMKLLTRPQKFIKPRVNNIVKDKYCYATAYNFSNSDVGIIRNEIANLLNCDKHMIEINNSITCSDLFDEYSKSMYM